MKINNLEDLKNSGFKLKSTISAFVGSAGSGKTRIMNILAKEIDGKHRLVLYYPQENRDQHELDFFIWLQTDVKDIRPLIDYLAKDLFDKDVSSDNFSLLSKGERSLLFLFGDILSQLRFIYPANPAKAKGIILIDEIELHLHPYWQQLIIPKMKEFFSESRFVITTNSPLVVGTIKKEDIYLVERLGDETFIGKPYSSYGLDSSRILEDLMGVDSRPREIKEKIEEMFDLLDKNLIEDASRIREELIQSIGKEDAEIVRASTLIRRLKCV